MDALRTRPMGAVTGTIQAKDPAASGEWPKTELIGEIDYEDYSHAPTRTAIPVPAATPPTARHAAAPPAARARPTTSPPPLPRAAAPVTVIPVPALPTMQGSAQTHRFEPVVRTQTSQLPALAARRLGKGTEPLDSETKAQDAAAMSDDTQTQVNLSIGDRTTPGIAMPLAARAVQLPSVKRRAAQRG
jgi:hypothetical protein